MQNKWQPVWTNLYTGIKFKLMLRKKIVIK